MTFGKILYTLILMPLQLLFETVYDYAVYVIDKPGYAIIALSLAINLLILPLYNRADALQEQQRETEARLSRGVKHIKKTFRGDECTMILQTYYRQNGYSPLSMLRGMSSLLLEIPFFIAAYRFLSNLGYLNGAKLWMITDLSKPDGLIRLAGMAINILPVLMTAVNLASCVIFTKGQPLKAKLQLYGMAIFFLFFLYDSPSGLVFYWTLNNIFSLIKTVILKMKNRTPVLAVLCTSAGLASFAVAVSPRVISLGKTYMLIFAVIGLTLFIPIILIVLKKLHIALPTIKGNPNDRMFIAGALLLTALTGLLIPSTVLASSPQEFVSANLFVHPLWYLLSAFLTAAGTFVLWFGVFYRLASTRGKVVFNYIFWITGIVGTVNYLFFGTKTGTLNSVLKYTAVVWPSNTEKMINLAVVILLAVALAFVTAKKGKIAAPVMSVLTAVMVCMSVMNTVTVSKSIAQMDVESAQQRTTTFTLSKTGKNVIVLMLDRAMGEYIPYIFNEKPELQEKFNGFTYYANTVSFGGHTNFATPALFGGYEYTPVELNRRDDESLADKYDEAIKVLPVLFDENGYDVTVCDIPYAGYQWSSDMSVYDEYSNINAQVAEGKFTPQSLTEQYITLRFRNFFCYSIVKTAPLLMQDNLYNLGKYHRPAFDGEQIQLSPHTASGMSADFCNSYGVLENLSEITEIANEGNTFLMMDNNATHALNFFQEPDYVINDFIDNAEYDLANTDRFTVNGVTLRVESYEEYGAYQTNMAVMLRLADWFDYMRENGVYDNTRIILVSDHGYVYWQLNGYELPDLTDSAYNYMQGSSELYYPLLMVKDFDADGFTTNEEFMTNADTPTLAVQGIIDDPVNPFTGKPINSEEKTAHPQYVILSDEWDISVNNGNQFKPARWYAVEKDMRDSSNWSIVSGENTVISSYPWED